MTSAAGRFLHFGRRLASSCRRSSAQLRLFGLAWSSMYRSLELAEREDLACGPFLRNRIATFGHCPLCLACQFARVGQSHGRVATQRQALLATVLVAKKHRPRAHVVSG